MKIATSIADFRGYVEDDAGAVRAFEGTGFKHLDYSFYIKNYDGSEFMGNDWVKEISKAAKEAEKLGFDFVQAHSPGNDYFREDPENVIKGNIRSIEACAYLGVSKLVVHSGRSSKFHGDDDMKKYIDEVKRFYEALYPSMEKYNVQVLSENYTPAGNGECSFYGGEDLVNLMEACNHPLMGVCWDIGHGNLTRPDQYDDIVKLGKYLKAVHIQDNFGRNDNHLSLFCGTTDPDKIMCALRDNGFIDRGGVFTLEIDNIVSHLNVWKDVKDENGVPLSYSLGFNVRKKAEELAFEIGKSLLTKYNCFEN